VGSTYVRVYKIEKDEDVVSDKLELAVAPVSELKIDIEKDDVIYNPNQPVTLKFKVTEGDSAIAAALGISIIDQSLYALSEAYGGFEDIYFELEQTALEPRYQIWEYIFSSETPSNSIPLPETNILDPGEYDEGYSYPKIGLQSNWNAEQNNAESVKSDYINSFWSGVFIFTFLGLVGLAIVGARRSKPIIVVVILALLVVATVVGGVVLNLDEINNTVELEQGQFDDKSANAPGGGDAKDAGGGDGDGAMDWVDEMDDAAPAAQEDVDNDFFPRVMPGFIDGNEKAINDYEPEPPTEPEDPADTSIKRETEKPRVREWFPETWYWNPVLITDSSGNAELKLTTPDSITTWEIKAVGSTKNAKLGVNNENLTVFQQFFIEPDIPVSVVRNDTFPLRIMVYNYDNVSHEVTVTLEEDSWFEVLDDTTQKVTVPADNVSKVMFDIRALEVGEHDVSVSGTNGIASDMVIKPMRVDPDGKRVSETINGKLSDNQSVTETITKSSLRVPNSENAFIKLQAGMEAVLLDGAETFIRRVSGCGEQSMSSLNIDILAFDTVTKLGTSTEEKMFEYEHIVTDGIQHELQYLLPAKNGKGRGIVWFPDDEDVHQWLTSWGLITFQDAIDAGFEVDNDIITDMQTWLLSQQEDDGSFVFPERGLYEFTNPILRSKTVSCSAYITRSLIYSGYSPSNSAIQKAVNYIEDHAKDNWDDPYTISIVLIVLEDANGDSILRTELSDRLEELKKDGGNGTVYWSSGTSMITDSDNMEFGWVRGYGYGSNYHSIETTGYALMALAKSKSTGSQTVQGAIKYLIENRQGLGGWFSTQDTVVAFQALKQAGSNKIEKLDVEIYADNSQIDKITFDKLNIDLTFLTDLRPYLGESTRIKIQSTGSGSVMYQIYYEEYIPWEIIGADKPQELILNISYDTTDIKVNDRITANLELKYMGTADHIKMVLVDLRAPIGFSFVEEDFEAMKTSGAISQYEINNRQAYLYIEDLSYGEIIKVTYRLEANDPIRGTIQGVQAYDMYNPNLISELEPVEITASE
jgi:CD109 antigen